MNKENIKKNKLNSAAFSFFFLFLPLDQLTRVEMHLLRLSKLNHKRDMGMKSEEEFSREPESGNTGVVDENTGLTHKASRCFNLFPSAFNRCKVSPSPT